MKKKVLVSVLVLVVLVGLFGLFFTGPRSDANYPSASESPYLLPWEAGVSRLCTQGNRSFFTHRGFYEFSYDFWMVTSTKVFASRGGTVTKVVDHEKRPGWFDGNQIVILHEDGTQAVYAHLDYKGSRVKMGDFVTQGQHIGFSGMTGRTIYPHLHFHVLNAQGSQSIPITFKEVNGIALAGQSYQSANISR